MKKEDIKQLTINDIHDIFENRGNKNSGFISFFNKTILSLYESLSLVDLDFEKDIHIRCENKKTCYEYMDLYEYISNGMGYKNIERISINILKIENQKYIFSYIGLEENLGSRDSLNTFYMLCD